MKITKPKITRILPTGPFTGRKTTGIFLYKHGMPDNLIAVVAETERTVDSHLEKCLILPEGLHSYKCAENLYIDRMVDALGLEAIDPIVKPFSAEIAHSAKISNIQGALSVVINYVDCIFGVDVTKMNDEELKKWFDPKLEIVASAFDIKPEEIRNRFEQLVQLGESKKARQIVGLSYILDALIRESNQQSKLKLAEILALRKQPKILVISGIAHEPIFK